jgi:hypothetical protein
MPFPLFDRSKLRLQPLKDRRHDLSLADILALDAPRPEFSHPSLPALAARLVEAKSRGAAAILLMGAHVLRAGVGLYLIDLMERGLITHLATNGAGPIHDWELALAGGTTESVARYVRTGEFGLWEETGRINEAIAAGARQGLGLGEAVGRSILGGDFPHRRFSIFAAAARLGIPATVHIGIGYDIIHEHPNCDGAALGQTSYQDFLALAAACQRLEGGVVLNLGSSVMGPEVYLKALTMARNVARQQGKMIGRITTGVFDLVPLQGDLSREADKTDPHYYFRPWKTMLIRTVADGGESHYIQGDHRQTIPALYHAILDAGGRAVPEPAP